MSNSSCSYPNLGHFFYPSSKWATGLGPNTTQHIDRFYSWLEEYSGFTHLYTFMYSLILLDLPTLSINKIISTFYNLLESTSDATIIRRKIYVSEVLCCMIPPFQIHLANIYQQIV